MPLRKSIRSRVKRLGETLSESARRHSPSPNPVKPSHSVEGKSNKISSSLTASGPSTPTPTDQRKVEPLSSSNIRIRSRSSSDSSEPCHPPSLAQASEPKQTLWHKAFNRLSEADRNDLPFDDTDKHNYLERLLEETVKSREACQERGLKIKFGHKTFVVRDLADKVLSWIDAFKSIGDTIVQYDPGHASLPWAGLRLLLMITLKESENMGAVVLGVERITRTLVRSGAYEKYYINSSVDFSNKSGLGESLCDLYGSILHFLASSKRFLDINRTKRFTYGLLDREGMRPQLDLIDETESSFMKEVAVAEKDSQYLKDGDFSCQMKELQACLSKLDQPIMRIDKNMQDMFELVKENEKGEIVAWLSKIEYEAHHNNAKEGLLEDTGRWLHDRNDFQEWQTSSTSGVLWLHGIPGAGKTKLTCKVIETLRSRLKHSGKHHRSETLIHFYCNRNEPNRRDPTKLLQALVKQLSLQRPDHVLPKIVVEIWNQRKKDGHAEGSLNFRECHTLLASLLDSYMHTTIVIDALDEVDSEARTELLALMSSITQSAKSLVKVFVSSRDRYDISRMFKDVPQVHIDATNSMKDIKRFVLREINYLVDNGKLLHGKVDRELRSLIVSTLCDNANGMFLWVDLQLKNLCKIPTKERVKKELGKLPRSLTETYNAIYELILNDEYGAPVAHSALAWIMSACKPIGPEEWAGGVSWALATSSGQPEDVDIHILLDICQDLVVIDRQQGVMRFAHLSVAEFLETKTEFEPSHRARLTAESCISILQHSLTSVPFYQYASSYWPKHLQQCNDDDTSIPRLSSMLATFMGSPACPTASYTCWIHNRTDAEELRPPNPVLAAAAFGLNKLCCHLWDSETFEPNYTNVYKQTLLFLASKYGHASTVKLLLYKGSNVNHVSHWSSNSPLSVAITNCYPEVLQLLLEAHAELRSLEYSDILSAGAQEGNAAVFKVLLAWDINATITEDLVMAAIRNNRKDVEVLKQVLARARNLTITEDVIYCVYSMSNRMMEILTAWGAHLMFTENFFIIAARDFDGKVMKILLTSFGHEIILNIDKIVLAAVENKDFGDQVVRLLLPIARDVNLSITEEIVRAAANNWISGKQALELLLGWSAILPTTAILPITETAIITIAKEFEEETMDLLLAHGVKIPLTDEVVTAAAGNWMNGKNVMELLLAQGFGAGVTITSRVVMAVANNNTGMGVKVMEMLLAADINLTITKAAIIAIEKYCAEVESEIRHMLASAKNSNFTMAEALDFVSVPARKWKHGKKIMELLLSRGAQLQILDDDVVFNESHDSTSLGTGTLVGTWLASRDGRTHEKYDTILENVGFSPL